MKLQDISRFLLLFLTITIIFFLGYLAGNRDHYDKTDDKIKIKGPNSSIQNSLSSLKTKDVIGFAENNTEAKYGLMYYKILPDKSTEILINISNVPLVLKQAVQKQERSIPQNLQIKLARRALDGLKYNYTSIGVLTFEEPKNGFLSVTFSTNIDPIKIGNEVFPALSDVDRIVFMPTKVEDNNIFILNNSDIPSEERKEPAPYFWIKN
jgi:regulatory protein YycI of two-component signal transduction system YycFG